MKIKTVWYYTGHLCSTSPVKILSKLIPENILQNLRALNIIREKRFLQRDLDDIGGSSLYTSYLLVDVGSLEEKWFSENKIFKKGKEALYDLDICEEIND